MKIIFSREDTTTKKTTWVKEVTLNPQLVRHWPWPALALENKKYNTVRYDLPASGVVAMWKDQEKT